MNIEVQRIKGAGGKNQKVFLVNLPLEKEKMSSMKEEDPREPPPSSQNGSEKGGLKIQKEG